MPSISSSVNELRSSVVSIGFGLFPSFLAVFNAILALGRDIVGAVLNLGQALCKAGVGIAGGIAELLWGVSALVNWFCDQT